MGREINDNFLSFLDILFRIRICFHLSFHPCFPPISITSLDRVSSIALLNGQNFSNLLVIFFVPLSFFSRLTLFFSFYKISIPVFCQHSNNTTIIIFTLRENLNYISQDPLRVNPAPLSECYICESRKNRKNGK